MLLKSAGHVKFAEEYVICVRRSMFYQKYLQMGQTTVHDYKLELKRESIKWKHIDFPVNKKFWAQRSVKKVILTVFWNRKGPMTIDFHKKRGNCKQRFLMPTTTAKFLLIYWMTLVRGIEISSHLNSRGKCS